MEETQTNERLCIHCLKNKVIGRSDKVYCSESCRSEANNERVREQRQSTNPVPTAPASEPSVPDFIKGINEILLNNHRILDEILGTRQTCQMKQRDIDGRGFRFKYFTSCSETEEGEAYYFCYELGYKKLENEKMVIVRRPREVIH